MTLVNIKAATAGIADTVVSDDAKLFPEVVKMVQNMPGGVSGIVKQFQDRGLRNVAASLIATGGIKTISPEQIVHGLGMQKIEALATASKLDVKVVRKALVTVLPNVLEQLTPAKKALEAVAVA